MKQVKLILGTFLTLCAFAASAQSEWLAGGAYRQGDKIMCNAIVENGDTIAYLTLAEVNIIEQRHFKTEAEKKQWTKLKRDVKKAYPFAVLASIKLREFDATLMTMKTELERDAYMKKAEKELKKQFEKELQKLTLNQGRILIRLIDRETGNTTYSVVKQMRGSFSAFFWQSFASLFGSSLKTEYDPQKGEDKTIEQIIHLIENNQI